MDKQQEFVLRTLEERDIRFVRLWFTDVLGFLKSVAVAPAELEGAFAEGIGFDGSADRGLRPGLRVGHAGQARPVDVPGAARGAARRRGPRGCSATSTCPTARPSYADPRYVLKRALAKAAELGFTFYTHPEIEFFLFKERSEPGRSAGAGRPGRLLRPHPARHGARLPPRRRSRCSSRWASRWSSATTRARPGQQEIDLRYADALTTADNIMTFRLVMKEVALEQGVYASFMPKPFAEHPGSGMHTHLSLFEGDRNAFHEAGAEYQLSKIGRAFIAGLLRHATEITAVTNQWVNSYKRLCGGGEAPAYVCWGHNNRSALVRVPMYKPGKGQSTRVEVRSLDAACNPYLAFAVLLAAGLKGIEEGYELPRGAEDDVWR